MLRWISTFALTFVGWFMSCAAFAADRAPDIEIAGLRTLSSDVVLAPLRVAADPPNAEALDAALKAIMATGFFSDARIEHHGKKLLVTVVENPIVGAVVIEGASALDKASIDAEIKIKPNDRLTKTKLHEDEIRVRDLYRRRGRLATTVAARSAEKSDGRRDVAFAIKEGDVTKVDRIEFSGAKAFSGSTLRDVITTSVSSWLDILKTAAFYDPERIESDRDLIRLHYVNHGYPDARVTEVKADLNATRTGYVVTFVIDEGERHSFGAPKISSKVAGLDAASLATTVKVKAGADYDRSSIDRSIATMSEMLSQSGQPFARVEVVPTLDRQTRRVDLVFRIEPGKPLYVERIDIAGNQNTKDFVIRRELRLAEGDPINLYLMESARARIKALGFFKSVDMKLVPGSSGDKTKLTIVVVEQETATLGFGVGYSLNEGVIGDISWTERNLLGNGQYLQLKLAGSAARLQADVAFTEPHFLGSNVAAGFDIFYKDIDNTLQSSFKALRMGGDLRLSVPFTDHLSTSVNYTFVRNTLYDVGPLASLAIREALAPGATTASYNTSSVGLGVTYDTRDNKKHPTSGVYMTVGQDVAGLGGDVRYVRTVADSRAYYALSDSVTVMGRVTGGAINGWGGQDVRLLDLFYKGGETVRGFAPSGLGPRDMQSANQDALGGRMYTAATAEAMFQLPGVPKDLGLSGSAFVDAGSLWGANRTAAALPGVAGTAAALRVTTGVGLTWDSPLGPLRADYAIPLVKQATDKTQPFSFGIAPY